MYYLYLVLTLYSGITVDITPFNSLKSCEQAKQVIMQDDHSQVMSKSGYCVKK